MNQFKVGDRVEFDPERVAEFKARLSDRHGLLHPRFQSLFNGPLEVRVVDGEDIGFDEVHPGALRVFHGLFVRV